MNWFSKDETQKFLKIHCAGDLNSDAATEFSNQTKAWMLSSVEHFILDFEDVSKVEREFYQSIIHFKTTLKKDQKVLYTVNLPDPLLKQFKEDGVDLAFNPVKSIERILNEQRGRGQKTVDVNFINPFLTATKKTLEVQCKTPAKPLKPYLKQQALPEVAIAGVLNLSSNGYSGSIVLCFSKPVFLEIYKNLFGEEIKDISPETEDAAAELLNIIYGMAKIELNNKGYNFEKALPTVLTGKGISVRQAGQFPAVVIPFETKAGQFHIEIEFSQNVGGN